MPSLDAILKAKQLERMRNLKKDDENLPEEAKNYLAPDPSGYGQLYHENEKVKWYNDMVKEEEARKNKKYIRKHVAIG